MKKVCETFKAGGTLATLTLTHNLGTRDVIVQVYEIGGEQIMVGIAVDEHRVHILFNEPPDFDVRVVVIG